MQRRRVENQNQRRLGESSRRESGSIPFDHDKIFRTIFAVDLAVEMILETTGLVLVDRFGEVRQELGDL